MTASDSLVTLFDRSSANALPLPTALAARYGGALGFALPPDRPYLVANFVSTLDGVVSFALPGRAEARLISAGAPADRFVLGLLRACADALVVGAGTLRVERTALWTPEQAFPSAAADFAALRRALGKPPFATVVLVSARGDLDRDAPVFRGPAPVRVLEGRRTAREILDAVAAETRARLVVSEGGPRVLGAFLHERLLDELFLTLSPQLAGRSEGEPRPGLVEGAAFTPEEAPWSELVSVKRSGDYVFLRCSLTGPKRASGQ